MAQTPAHRRELELLLSGHWRRFVNLKIWIYVLPAPATSFQIQSPVAGVYGGFGAPPAVICSFQIRLKRLE